MALSAADQLLVVRDTLRGLEADQLRAEILASSDQGQAERLVVLEAQIKVAKLREEKLAAEVEEEEENAVPTSRPDGPGVPPEKRTQEWYEAQTKDELVTLAEERNVDVKKSWAKEKLIEAHQERDALEGPGG